MQYIEMMLGAPACGKSTYAKAKIANEPNWVRVNKDDIRIELGSPEHSQAIEKKVVKIEDERIEEALKEGKNVIVDDTNLSPKHLQNHFKPMAAKFGAEVVINKDFLKVPMHECIRRNKLRKESVPEVAIRSMFKMYGFWTREERYWLNSIEKNMNKKPAFICDIDGTVAFADNRSYYEETKCATDVPNTPVIEVIKSLCKNNTVLFVSGRKDTSRQQTTEYLQKHVGTDFEKLIMRRADDNRPDDILKEEIYRTQIEPFYNIIGVFDDRMKVVKKWKELGLFVFDCNQSGAEF